MFAFLPVVEIVAQETPLTPDLPNLPDMPTGPDMPDIDIPDVTFDPLEIDFICPAEGSTSLTWVIRNPNSVSIPFVWNNFGDLDGVDVIEANGEVEVTVPLVPDLLTGEIEVFAEMIGSTIVEHFSQSQDCDDDNGNGGGNGTSTTTTTGTLILIKEVVNENENGTTTATSSDFELILSRGDAATSTIGSATGTLHVLPVGVYSLTETTSSEYVFTQEFSTACQEGVIAINENATTTCTVTNTVTGTTTPPIVDGGGGNNNDDDDDERGRSGRSGSRRSSGGSSNDDGEVLGVTFGQGGDPFGALLNCPASINAYIKYGVANNSSEVIKLQNFLNDEVSAGLLVNGVYDLDSVAAVNEFQLKYNDEILQPWADIGLLPTDMTPTGYFYKTTSRWANSLLCNIELPMPPLP